MAHDHGSYKPPDNPLFNCWNDEYHLYDGSPDPYDDPAYDHEYGIHYDYDRHRPSSAQPDNVGVRTDL